MTKTDHPSGPERSPERRLIAAGAGWEVGEVTCHSGPEQRPFEEEHDGFTLAAVVSGSFVYHGENGRSLLHPGALLLGNHGSCYQCGHDHGAGDRCISINLAPQLFEELSSTAAGTSRFRFATGMAPASGGLLAAVCNLEAAARSPAPLQREEAMLTLAADALRHLTGHRVAQQKISPLDERRIATVIHRLDETPDEPATLGTLAALAGMSRFHFLRVFRACTGVTPHQYVLSLRMRRAALALATSRARVTDVAFGTGFGDLSTFNARFRKVFRMPPLAYRAALSAPAPEGRASTRRRAPGKA